MKTYFLEIVIDSADFTLDDRDEIEQTLDAELAEAALGEVTGAGSVINGPTLGLSNIDVEVNDLEAGLQMVRDILKALEVAPSTVIHLRADNGAKTVYSL